MNVTKWQPFPELDTLFRQYTSNLPRALNGNIENWAPAANITENDKEYLIKAELPEVKKEDIKITLENGTLTISGERKHEKESKEENEIRVESFYGTFSRSFYLPDNIDTKGIHAETKDGILRVRIPKTANSTAKTVSVPIQ